MSAGARASMIILHAVDDYAAGAAARARARTARPTHRLHRLGAQNAERSPSLKRKWNSSAVADGSSERNVRRSLGLLVPFLDFPFQSVTQSVISRSHPALTPPPARPAVSSSILASLFPS